MGDFRVNGAFVLCCLLFTTIVKPVLNTGFGKCPVYPQLPNFDIARMAGTWFEVERSFYIMELSASCTELNLAIDERGYLLITINTVNRLGSPSTTYGLGIPSHNGSSLFRYKVNNRMPYIIGRLLPGAGLYNILFTDYDKFAIIWSCTSVSVAHSDRIWILGREREIQAELRAQIYALMMELRLDPDRLIISKNYNCSAAELPGIN
ncbi:apolipoprotein D isoform X2 [Amyelois transitella]|uniref:apolipoprotein D isoform X2 n=1 Tax=Amyelois transitella TaxID=680683 RepID=UPI00298FD120|nr:apolipoprotein D isoform X2 [Amyelois transitella]